MSQISIISKICPPVQIIYELKRYINAYIKATFYETKVSRTMCEPLIWKVFRKFTTVRRKKSLYDHNNNISEVVTSEANKPYTLQNVLQQ